VLHPGRHIAALATRWGFPSIIDQTAGFFIAGGRSKCGFVDLGGWVGGPAKILGPKNQGFGAKKTLANCPKKWVYTPRFTDP